MDTLVTVIRWQRAGSTRMTLWHFAAGIASDTRERTQCGRYVDRHKLESGRMSDGPLCRLCLRAMGGSYPVAGAPKSTTDLDVTFEGTERGKP